MPSLRLAPCGPTISSGSRASASSRGHRTAGEPRWRFTSRAPWLTPVIPTAQIAIVDAASARLRVITPATRDIIGFFGPSWSPDSRQLLFFSVDTNAAVHAWLWSAGGAAPRRFDGVTVADSQVDPPRALWTDSAHVVLRLRDPKARPDGPLYFSLQRGRNVADDLQRARSPGEAVVSVFESRGRQAKSNEPKALTRLASIDVRSRAIVTLATGAIHAARLSADRRTVTYREESPAVHAARVDTFFGPDAARGEAVYDAVNWGAAIRHVDAQTGAVVQAPATASVPPAAAPEAERSSLRAVNDPAVGTTLVLRRPGQPEVPVWTGNTWIREITAGRAEAIAYKSTTGAALTGWLLFPPGHVAGQKLPIVTIVYPGRVYSERGSVEPRPVRGLLRAPAAVRRARLRRGAAVDARR